MTPKTTLRREKGMKEDVVRMKGFFFFCRIKTKLKGKKKNKNILNLQTKNCSQEVRIERLLQVVTTSYKG